MTTFGVLMDSGMSADWGGRGAPAGWLPEEEFLNSEELSLIKSSPLPAAAPAGEELTPLDSSAP